MLLATSPPPPAPIVGTSPSSRRSRQTQSSSAAAISSSSKTPPRRSPRLAVEPSAPGPAPPPPPPPPVAATPTTPSPLTPSYPFNAPTPDEATRRARLAAACEGLSSLCSQYHTSDYNRLKWGEGGAPMVYCPLTVLAPEHVEAVMKSQAELEQRLIGGGIDDSDEESAPQTPGSSWTWERVEVAGERTREPSPDDLPKARRTTIRAEEGLEGTPAVEVTDQGTVVDPRQSCDVVDVDVEQSVRQAMSDSITSQPIIKTSHSHPINVSFVLPPALLSQLPPLQPISNHPLAYACPRDVLADVLAAPAPLPAPITSLAHPPPSPLGNLFLSSCPGKKVRLDGPVRGRGGICRDLAADLSRIRSLGVGCIVCCLDDEELSFLGAPWAEYARVASSQGLDVVRIPMPEGLAPASIDTFDAQLDRIVRKYTLRGTHVLAHCRGGVGRAGLTACAWAIKLGVIGPAPHQDSRDDDAERHRIMSTVERAICLVRRRRSVKAIETFEQVNFLVTYVAWLRRSGLNQ